jgi:hypothetical protein
VSTTDPSEFQVHRISMGAIGKDEQGKVIEAVVVEYSLPTGYRSAGDWPMDAEDREVINMLADIYEKKIKAWHAGEQRFTPTAQSMGFEADRT